MAEASLYHYCIVCGQAFHAAEVDIVLCPDCGGPSEAEVERAESVDTLFTDTGATLQASPDNILYDEPDRKSVV